MPLKKVAYLRVLMTLAKELGRARQSGDPNRIREAERRHEEYRLLCLDPEVVVETEYAWGDLYGNSHKNSQVDTPTRGNYTYNIGGGGRQETRKTPGLKST